jgi:hypothetical protein
VAGIPLGRISNGVGFTADDGGIWLGHWMLSEQCHVNYPLNALSMVQSRETPCYFLRSYGTLCTCLYAVARNQVTVSYPVYIYPTPTETQKHRGNMFRFHTQGVPWAKKIYRTWRKFYRALLAIVVE